jgi:hypothetical protein
LKSSSYINPGKRYLLEIPENINHEKAGEYESQNSLKNINPVKSWRILILGKAGEYFTGKRWRVLKGLSHQIRFA